MGTIKPYNSDEMRVKASERIHSMFKNVPFIYIKYRDTYAEGYCQYKDGLVVSFTVWYRDLLIRTSEVKPESPHEKAMAYVKSLEEKPWAP